MKKFLGLTVIFLGMLFFLCANKAMALEVHSQGDPTKITLTYNKTTAVADGSDTINFWYGAYFTATMPPLEFFECSSGATEANPFPATKTVPGQLCRAAAFSNKMTLVITGDGNNVSPSPLGEHGGILPDYNLISGTGEFTLKSSTPGEKTVTYSASGLMPGVPAMTISMTVNFVANTAGSGNNTAQGSTTTNTTNTNSNQSSQTGGSQVSSTASNGATTQGNGSASTVSTTATGSTATNNQASSNGSQTGSTLPGGMSYAAYYAIGAGLVLVVALLLYWFLYYKKRQTGSDAGMKVFGIVISVLVLVFIAASGWLFIQNKNLAEAKSKAENDLSAAKADLETSKATTDKKITGVANKIEAMSLIFGGNAREQNSFTRAGDLIRAMNDEALNVSWAAMEANRGQATGEKVMSDLITAAANDLKK